MSETVFVVEDDPELRDLLVEVLNSAGFQAGAYANGELALRAIDQGVAADVVITDLRMPGMGGEELLAELRKRSLGVNVVVITAFGSIESAIVLIKAGAYDYLTKPVNAADLVHAVKRALAESDMRRSLARREGSGRPAGFVGATRPVVELFQLIARAAHSRHPVIITGESGTGKELVARALHAQGTGGPFIALNCAALPENLLESELFGHEKGAFTGADRPKPGLFEAAHGGTLFLDEVAELPLALQPKLLRAIEQDEIRRVGATAPRSLQVRIIAATNRNLEDEIEAGRFRSDLFWRLNVLHLDLPPLRERREDVPLLAEHFLQHQDGLGPAPHRFAPETLEMLQAYPWPGNVRELRNAVWRATTLATGEEILPRDLPPRIREGPAAGRPAAGTQPRVSLREYERRYLLEVLAEVGGNKTGCRDCGAG